MAIGTTAALLGAAVIGGAGTALGASKASKAAKYASDQTAEATRESNALNRYIYDQTRADNETRRQVGDASLMALANGMGLRMPTASTSASPGAAMTGAGAQVGGSRPSVISAQGYGGYGGGANVVGSNYAGSVDYNQLFADRPDVMAEYERARAAADPNSPAFTQRGLDSPEAYADYWLANRPAEDTYAAPRVGEPQVLPADAGPVDPNAPASGYGFDPSAPGGYMIGERPDLGAGPGAYVAPNRQEFGGPRPSLNLSLDAFRVSPDYEFRVREGERSLGGLMSSTGGRLSGQRVKAALERNQNLADAEYTDWANRQIGIYGMNLGQYNTDRGRSDNIYESDRGFGYGQSRDARSDFTQDRSRSDGLYADDRGYNANRYDTRNQTLLNLAGFGPSASNSNAAAGQSWAQSTAANNMTAANARGDAAIAGANAWNQGLGNLMTTGAYLYGQGAFGGGGSSLPKTYNI